MKGWCGKAVMLGVAALVGVGGVFGGGRQAWACSEAIGVMPQAGWDATFTEPIAAGGAWAFVVQAYAQADFRQLVIEAQMVDGEPVSGSVEVRSLDDLSVVGDDGSADKGAYLVVWRPDGVLQEDTRLTMTVRVEPDPLYGPAAFEMGTVEVEWSGEALADEEAASRVTFEVTGLEVVETPGGTVCCSDSALVNQGGCSSESCWPTWYDYLPTIEYSAAWAPEQEGGLQFYHILTSNNGAHELIWGNSGSLDDALAYAHETDEPACYELTTYALGTGEQVAQQGDCVEPDAFGEYQERELEPGSEERPDTCVGDDYYLNPEDEERGGPLPPHENNGEDAGAQPDAGDLPDVGGQPDAGDMPDAGGDSDTGDAPDVDDGGDEGGSSSGCSTAGGSPDSFVVFSAVFGALILRRHGARRVGRGKCAID